MSARDEKTETHPLFGDEATVGSACHSIEKTRLSPRHRPFGKPRSASLATRRCRPPLEAAKEPPPRDGFRRAAAMPTTLQQRR